MRAGDPSLPQRCIRKLRSLAVRSRFRAYLSGIGDAHPLHGIPARLVGDASADPTEFFDHYDAFAFWAGERISKRNPGLKTLDVGGIKMMNAMLSISHDVTSLVLAHCGDQISRINYIQHDVSDRLPFANGTFDLFTSTVALPLVGLSRYGDRLNPNCLIDLIAELDRVMKPDSELLISMCLGKNVLNFNNGWFFDLPTIERLFGQWRLIDVLVDGASSPKQAMPDGARRFSKDTSVDKLRLGDYRVIFLQLARGSTAHAEAS